MAGEVRVAAFGELPADTAYRLWALRSEVFVVEQDCPYLDLDGLGRRARRRGTCGSSVAACRWPRCGSSTRGCRLRIGRVATRAAHRGAGLAAALVDAALALAGERAVVLDAQSHLVDWYTGFGFEPSGRGFVEDGIPHTPMRRAGA